MRKLNLRMAREIYRKGFVVTKKYYYYENKENGMVYRVPAEMLDTTDILNMENHQLVCTHGELCDIVLLEKGGEKIC